jgi:putative nucleotidyltransferase with HDIG domain
MQVYAQTRTSANTFVGPSSSEHQNRRKARLMSILTEGLPTLPNYVLELNTLLSSASVDLKRVGKVIRNDPSLSAQVLRLCNSALFSLRRRVLSIEEAAVLMGSERLRTLVLTCSIMEFSGRQLPRGEIQTFWQHSFMSGMLSERIARWLEYTEREQAYLGGLLHDIGTLPILMVAKEESVLSGETKSGPWGGTLESEKDFFGMTHCEVGRWIGQAWNFFPSFIDVFENHHSPNRSIRDPHLVGIVAAADHFCEGRAVENLDACPVSDAEELAETGPDFGDEFLRLCLPLLDAKERSELTEMLETEYLHLLPVIEFNNPAEMPVGGSKS